MDATGKGKTSMNPSEARSLNPEDLVTHIHDTWDEPQIVAHVDAVTFPEDPVVFFVAGGFWRASRLKQVGTS